jgi:hypothetical protein
MQIKLQSRGGLLLVMENEEESALVDKALGSAVQNAEGLISDIKGQVRLSDGYGSHYISLQQSEHVDPNDETTLLQLFQKTAQIVNADLANGRHIDSLIRSAGEEFGEVCRAISIESGQKSGSLAESSRSEAIDLLICAVAIYFAKAGRLPELVRIMDEKLSKWQTNSIFNG